MRLVLTADTHVPRRARDLPAVLWSEIRSADVVVHAGDWVDVSLLDALESRLRADQLLVACYGNNDGPALRARLPEVGRAELAGVRLAVVHETGPATGRGAEPVSGPHVVHRDGGTELWMAFVNDPDGTPVGLMAERPAP